MAGIEEAKAAAKKQPKYRSVTEQALVDHNMGDQNVRNLDHDAKLAQQRGIK